LQKRPNLFGASTFVKESAGGWIRKKTGRMLTMRMRMRMRRRGARGEAQAALARNFLKSVSILNREPVRPLPVPPNFSNFTSHGD
jgi:hypothetical protein